MGVELNLFKCEKATRRALWGQRGIERGKKRENKAAHKRGGDRRMMEMGGKICLWLERETKLAHY